MQFKKLLPKLLIVAFVVAFGILCAFTGSITAPVGTLWSLFPPVIAIGLALITKEVYSSLFVGILAGGLLATNFNPLKTMDSITNDGFISAISGTAGIFAFLVILGIIVALLNKAGGSRAFGNWAAKHVKTKIGASLATFVFGVLIFIDDYFNCLTVGAVMRPVTDKAGISRSKLAYLIDATAAPICMIAPISSWAAAVTGVFKDNGIDGDGFAYFIRAVPYNLYSLMTFVFIIAIVLMKFDYGPMKLHEMNAANGDLFTSGKHEGKGEELEEGSSRAKVIDLLFPIIALIGICVFALFYIGAGGDFSANLITAFGDTDATVGLPWGGLIALIVTLIYFIARRLISFKDAMACVPKGFIAMVPAILILTMATALKEMTGLLDSNAFVNSALAGAGALQSFLPAIIFLVACGISFSTGTSWGTFGILIPIVLAVFPLGTELSVIGMSACLAGSVCGDHCSPISDTTIMSSAGAQCNHINHVSTQIPYAVTVAAISLAGYLLAGFVQNAYIVLAFSIVLTVGTLFAIKALTKNK
jgi:Na+/H+ antiporter NhaC